MRRQKRLLAFIVFTMFGVSLLFLPLTEARRKINRTPPTKKPTPKLAAPRPLSLTPQTGAVVPVSSQAVAFALSPAIRDLPPPEQSKPEIDAEIDVKPKPIKVVRREVENPSAVSEDTVVQDQAPDLNIPALSTSFEGMSIFDTIALGQGFLPPDTVGDVGPNHYVQTVNSTWRVWDKAGNPLIPARTLGSLWATIPGPCANTNAGDAIVLYDSLADRWFISQFCTVANPNNHQLIAISKTNDPTGQYYLYDFMMPNNKFNDYPKFGVWPDGYYMTDNQFNQAGTAFLGGGVFTFNRAKMLAGDPTANFIYFDLFGLNPNLGGMLPSDADGLTPPPPGSPNTFVYFTADEFGDPADALRLFDFHADFSTPANSTFTERAGSPLAVASFDPRSPAGRDNIEQPPPANNATAALDAISDRLMFRLQYRNFGGYESLVVNHTVNVGTGTTLALHQAGVRYYELRRTGGGNYAINEQATFAPDTTNRWMGSAAMDHEGNLAVGYSVSSTTVFPGIRYAGRLSSDPPNGLFQGEAVLQAGGFVQTHTSSRWGDYSSTNVDPVDDCTFWHTNEYYLDDQPNITAEWHTRIGSFKVNAACQAPAQGKVQVNVTNCGSGLPISGALVTIDGNLYGATEASGQNVSTLTPGSYTVNVSAGGYFPAAPVNATVTNGNTSVINVCLNGMPNVVSDGSTITAESCSPADNALSPGETVTINFGLKNSGTADTSNLVATLQATGGVTSPSGPQNYGVVVAGGATVARPFTFTVDPAAACGGNLTATLALQDGATNLGTVTFTFSLGTLSVGSTSASYSSGNLALPIPDVASVDVPINVTDTGGITDVNVRVRLNHTFDGDLEIRLIAPDGTTVLLSDNRGGAGDNFGTGANDCSGVGTIFDDSAAGSVTGGVAPFSGSFRPENPLSALNGKNPAGTWKVRFTDTAALDTGTVGCVQLEINRRRFVCCGVAGTPSIVSAPPATITAESCPPPNNAIDPEETVTVELPLRNNGDGSTTNLVATLVPGGGIFPVTTSQNYGVVGPLDPDPTSRPFTLVAQGNCGSTVTATLHLQDGATDLGNVTFTFVLGSTFSTTTTTANAAGITILDTPRVGGIAPSSPYPATINVGGVVGTVSKVTATIKGLNHSFPGDIDILLVGPGGQKLILMSDVGGGTDVVNGTITFDDTAAAPIGATVVSGIFKPTNSGTGDSFPPPAPAGPYPDPQMLSIFNGTNPNGVWSLYVVDDAGIDAGSITGGWELTITTTDPLCCDTTCTLTCPSDIVVSNDPGQCGANVDFSGQVQGSCGVVTYNHQPGSFFPVGTTNVTVTATRADGTTQSCNFNVTVNDTEGPTISGASASPSLLWPPNHKMKNVTVSYSASDNCTASGAINCSIISVTSNEPVNTTEDGDSAPDWEIVNNHLVRLRAERSGIGTGRIYTITIRCVDGAGNATLKTVTVSVPLEL